MGNDIYQKRDPMVKIEGRALYLSEDADQLQAQLEGTVLTHDPERKLIDNISTDEITPGWVCFWYDETLGEYSLIGLRGGHVKKDSLKNSGAKVIVSGLSKGCGSSRETAPFPKKSLASSWSWRKLSKKFTDKTAGILVCSPPPTFQFRAY